ncbi:MAG: nitroreductase family protein [Bacteroidales bacterium]|nr:nitroreductase family protein [Bacteroidales bacterium]MBN2757285.1 nitroreductase family protein [Bacteroidales bacterium]
MLKDLIKLNRSYRKFYEAEININTLKELIELAKLSPSPRNLQALKFIISNNKKTNNNIFEQLAWAGYITDWNGPEKGERPSAYIIILGDKNLSDNFERDFIYTASGIVSQSILLGAIEKELGGCIIAAIKKNKIKEILNISDDLEILLVIALGKPKEEIIIERVKNNDIKYWRDENEAHHVPKREIEELIIKIID